MTPRDEFIDLVSRGRNLFNAVLLFLITSAQLAVAACTLLLTIYITLVTAGRGVADRWKARITAPKEAVSDAA